jgi:Cu(I)/Ag(I) efflux system membrane fusion protein
MRTTPRRGVKVSPQLAQNLGVRTASPSAASSRRRSKPSGSIAFDERAVHVVQARTAGYIEALFVRAPLDRCARASRSRASSCPNGRARSRNTSRSKASTMEGAAELARAARNRLLLLNMSEEQVQAVDREGKPVTRVTLVSPADGVVGELGAREGMNVMPGTHALSRERARHGLGERGRAEAAAAACVPGADHGHGAGLSGERFAGRVSAVLPEVTAATRTCARGSSSQPGREAQAGMYATVADHAGRHPRVGPRAERGGDHDGAAQRRPGRSRRRALRAGRGRSRPRRRRATEIRKGIEAGTKVVASGQFLIDSKRACAERSAGLSAPAQAGAQFHRAEGKVERIGHHDLTISHGPVPS